LASNARVPDISCRRTGTTGNDDDERDEYDDDDEFGDDDANGVAWS
jgi:hypothetical protein